MTPRPESDEAAKEYYSFEEAVMGPIAWTALTPTVIIWLPCTRPTCP